MTVHSRQSLVDRVEQLRLERAGWARLMNHHVLRDWLPRLDAVSAIVDDSDAVHAVMDIRDEIYAFIDDKTRQLAAMRAAATALGRDIVTFQGGSEEETPLLRSHYAVVVSLGPEADLYMSRVHECSNGVSRVILQYCVPGSASVLQ